MLPNQWRKQEFLEKLYFVLVLINAIQPPIWDLPKELWHLWYWPSCQRGYGICDTDPLLCVKQYSRIFFSGSVLKHSGTGALRREGFPIPPTHVSIFLCVISTFHRWSLGIGCMWQGTLNTSRTSSNREKLISLMLKVKR